MSNTTGTVEESPPGGLFSGYVPPSGVYDELLTSDGCIREPWGRFVRGLEGQGSQALSQRWEQSRRLLRENGVTYNVYGAPQNADRPWELDPVPLLFNLPDWQKLSQGLTQRAELLNRITADLYGEQTLLKERVLPPSVVFAHPEYHLACHGSRPPGDVFIHLYAAHLARQPDGGWVALADRTQGPSGAGYAVENRIVISRTLPSDFASLHVERLAAFFMTLRETLLALCPTHSANPRVVLLSPGPRSSGYFEDAYLARYLGYSLVEGGDLTVRDGKVFLKTLGGLLRVDVILRRLVDEDCDPLELRPASHLGVPGLMHAVRSKQVLVANALGSGLLEAPAFTPFLPAICRHLLHAELLLPSVPSWWCGRGDDLRYVEAHLNELIIKPAYLHRSARPILGWELDSNQRAELLAKLRHAGGQYVAQARVTRSTMPVWSESGPTPWHVGLRTFAVAAGDTYRVMPGGLTRVSASADTLAESAAAGQGSKDVWVLSDKPVEIVSLLRAPGAAVEVRRSPFDLPSRVADHLYWLGRYVERAEGMVRHLRSAVVRLTNELEPAGVAELWLVTRALGEPDETLCGERPVDAAAAVAILRKEISALVFDEERYGLQAALQALRFSAVIVRDRISVDTWRIVNQLDLPVLFPWGARRDRLGDILLLLNQVLTLLSALGGLAAESMTRGPGWQFLDMGRRIERALHSLRLVERLLVAPQSDLPPVLEMLLEIMDSSMTYRYRYLTSLQIAPTLDLLLIDETNPRSVGFQIMALGEHIQALTRDKTAPATVEERVMFAAQAALRLTDLEALSQLDTDEEGDSRRAHLARFAEALAGNLRDLSDAITHKYLMHTAPPRQLAELFAADPL